MTALGPQSEGIPLPEPSLVSQPFWDGCTRGELWFQRCNACASAVFDPAPLCRGCGSDDLRWEVSSGQGQVYSWSTVWRPAVPAFAVPYAVVIVELDEGFHMISNLIGCDPESVRLGLRVGVEFHSVGDGVSLPYFRPRTETSSRQE